MIFIVYKLALREMLPWGFLFYTVSIFPPIFHTHHDRNTVVVREIRSRSLRTVKQTAFSVIGGAWDRRFSCNFSVGSATETFWILVIRSLNADPSISQSCVTVIGLLSHVLTTDLIAWNFPARHGVNFFSVCAKYPVLRKHATYVIKA